jgi:hypothetical protein
MYSWRDGKFLTHMFSDVHGDFYLSQFDHTPDLRGQTFLFPSAEPLVKRLQRGISDNGLNAGYEYWMDFLQHLLYFCCQTGMEVPFRDDYLDAFYDGKPFDENAGMLAEHTLHGFNFLREDVKSGKKDLFKMCLPEYPGFLEQSKEGWSFTGSIAGYSKRQAFIMDGNLVYCEEKKDGPVDFGEYGKFSEPKVIFIPDMIREAIFGVFSIVLNSGSRNMHQDPGLIMKYFPYFLFNPLLSI